MDDILLIRLNELFKLMSEKDPKSAEGLKQVITSYKDNLSMDNDLLKRLTDIANAHKEDLITGDNYTDLLHKINNNSIIVYFKSANVFRVYDAAQISTDLTNHLNVDFNKNKQMYEVIPNNLPQKIIIMCEPGIKSYISTIKDYLMNYMQSKGTSVKNDDIKIFENETGIVEIVVNGFYVENFSEREKVVSGLMRYIDLQERSNIMTDKMKKHEFNPFDNSQIVSMPNCKTSIDGKPFNLVEVLIRNIDKCTHMTNGNIYVNIETMNIAETIKTKNVSIITPNIGDFGKYIRNNKPEWYKPGTWFNKDILRNEYIEIYGDISIPTFHKTFVGKIFDKTTRKSENGIRVTKVLLFKYNKVLDLSDN